MKNSLPELIDTLRPTLRTVAGWASVSRGLGQMWQQGTYQPKAANRELLLKRVRQYAHRLLALADRVEREGGC